MRRQESKRSLFYKKAPQKTFINCGSAGSTGTAREESKIFCFFFLKKKSFFKGFNPNA
jgi:hypothetical protein